MAFNESNVCRNKSNIQTIFPLVNNSSQHFYAENPASCFLWWCFIEKHEPNYQIINQEIRNEKYVSRAPQNSPPFHRLANGETLSNLWIFNANMVDRQWGKICASLVIDISLCFGIVFHRWLSLSKKVVCDFCIWVSTGFAMVWCVYDSTLFACGNFWSSDAVPILRTPRDPSSCPLSRKGYEVTAGGRRHPLCLGQLHRFYIDRGLGPEVQRLSPTGPFVKSLVRVSFMSCHRQFVS